MSFLKRLLGQPTIPSQEKENREVIQVRLRAAEPFFQAELVDFLGVSQGWLLETLREFVDAPAAWCHLSQFRSPSRETDGLVKSLDVAEGFALWALTKRLGPRVVVELGVNRGISARLWKEALKRYVPDHRLILCDLVDHRMVIGDHEAEFLLGDAHVTLKKALEQGEVDLLYNDAHPYSLIEWSLKEGIKHGVPIFGFHDTGHKHPRGPYDAASASLPYHEKLENDENWDAWGTWERHAIADIFDRRALGQDAVDTDRWRIRHFDSLFGLSFVIARDKKAHG